jgi:PAS domain S-box-containing protein
MAPRKGKKTDPEASTAQSEAIETPATLQSDEAVVSLTDHRFSALEKVGEHSTDLMVVIDAQGIVIYANPIALQIFNKTLEEGIGANAFDYLHPDDLERVAVRFIDLLQMPGGSISDTIKSVAVNGEIREIEIVSSNWLDNDDVRGIIINGRDVT